MKRVVLAILIVAAWSSTAYADERIDLGDNYALTVATDHTAGTAKVSLDWNNRLLQSIVIGNASVDDVTIKRAQFCRGCSMSYFIPAPLT